MNSNDYSEVSRTQTSRISPSVTMGERNIVFPTVDDTSREKCKNLYGNLAQWSLFSSKRYRGTLWPGPHGTSRLPILHTYSPREREGGHPGPRGQRAVLGTSLLRSCCLPPRGGSISIVWKQVTGSRSQAVVSPSG